MTVTKNALLTAKVVVVTGAGRGIGRAIAIAMADAGAKVVVNDVGTALDGKGSDPGPAEETVTIIHDAGGESVVNHDSVAERDGAERIVQTAIDAFGEIHCVVNNAGILRDAIFHKLSHENWRAVLDVHLNGSFNVSRAVAPHFRAQEHGCFVHFTSTSGLVGNLGQANYAAAKMGIVGLSRSIALDLERFNVRSNCISPFAWSRMIGSIPKKSGRQQAHVKKLKTLTPETVAPLVVFLASDAASSISGQVFAVRGNEVFLMSQPRPLRTLHRTGGWTPDALVDELLPAFGDDMYPLETSGDVFHWDPPD